MVSYEYLFGETLDIVLLQRNILHLFAHRLIVYHAMLTQQSEQWKEDSRAPSRRDVLLQIFVIPMILRPHANRRQASPMASRRRKIGCPGRTGTSKTILYSIAPRG